MNIKVIPEKLLLKMKIQDTIELEMEDYKSEIENLKKKIQDLESEKIEISKVQLKQENENILKEDKIEKELNDQKLSEKDKLIEFSKFTNPVFFSQKMDPFIEETFNYFKKVNKIFSIEYVIL